MPRREDPKITIHTGIVAAVYPGATSREVEDQVTRKIEERLFRFAEVRRDKTFSTTRNGMVVINVDLDKSIKDSDEFWSKLRLDMAQLKATDLPAGVIGPVVDSDFGDTVAVLIAVHGGNYGPRELKDYAQTVETALRAIPAVSKIKRIGDQKEEIDIGTSSERLAQYGVNPMKVMRRCRDATPSQFAGRVPAGQSKVPIKSGGRLKTEDQIRQVMVDVSPTGQPVYIGDLATVERVYKDPTEYARIGGEQSILLAVEMHEGNNIVDFGNTLRKTLKQRAGDFAAGREAGLGSGPAQGGLRTHPRFLRRIRHCHRGGHPGDHAAAAAAGGAGLRHRHSGIGGDDLRHVERVRHRVATGIDFGADRGAGHGGGQRHRDCRQLCGDCWTAKSPSTRRRSAAPRGWQFPC